jgi:hypothetical protein
MTICGLTAQTTYKFKSKARNAVGIDSAYSSLAIVMTSMTGDINGDGAVDVVDLLYFVDAFGSLTGDANYDPACDFNNDGSVDVVDLLDLVSNFGT